MDPLRQPPVFMLSGFNEQKKKALTVKIKSLGGRVLDDLVFSSKCTHVVCQKPCRSEKFLCGLAMGKWILMEQYISHSCKRKKWLDEQRYEWGRLPLVPLSGPLSRELLRAPRRARLRHKREDGGAFSGWSVGLLIRDQPRADVYGRLLRCGGARVMTLKPATSTRQRLPPGLTHVFADRTQQAEVVPIAGTGVPCLVPDYIGDFLTGTETPCAKHYVLSSEPADDLRTAASSCHLHVEQKGISDNRQLHCILAEEATSSTSSSDSRTVSHSDVHMCNTDPGRTPEPSNIAAFSINVLNLTTVDDETASSNSELDQHGEVADLAHFSQLGEVAGSPVNRNVAGKSQVFPVDSVEATDMNSDLHLAADKSSPILNGVHCASSTVSDSIASCLEESRPLDAVILMQSSLSYNRGGPDSRALALFMRALQVEKSTRVGTRFYDVLCRCLVLYPTSDYENTLRHMDTMVSSTNAGMSHAWHLISSVLSDLINDKTKIASGLRENRLLLLKFLIKLFAADAASKEEQQPVQSLLYRALWSDQTCVNVSRRPVVDLLGFLSKLISAKDIESTLILLQLVELVVLLCHRVDDLQVILLSKQLASTIYSGTLCNHLFLERVMHQISPAWFAYMVCEHSLNMMTGSSKPRPSSAATSGLQRLVLQYCAIPSPRPGTSPSGNRAAGAEHNPKSSKSNKKDCKGETALHIACRHGDLSRVRQLLLEPGIDVGITDNCGWTPLHEACIAGRPDVVEELLKYFRAHSTNLSDGKLPLDFTALIGAKGLDGITPLHDAAAHGHVDVVRLLLRYGGTSLLRIQSDLGKLPIDAAHSPEMRLLLSGASALDPAAGSCASNSVVQSIDPGFHLHTSGSLTSRERIASGDYRKTGSTPAGLGTCSFNGCCCSESGQNAYTVAGYLHLFHCLVAAYLKMHGVSSVVNGPPDYNLAVLISFFDEHTRALACGHMLGGSQTNEIDIELLTTKVQFLQDLLPKDRTAGS